MGITGLGLGQDRARGTSIRCRCDDRTCRRLGTSSTGRTAGTVITPIGYHTIHRNETGLGITGLGLRQDRARGTSIRCRCNDRTGRRLGTSSTGRTAGTIGAPSGYGTVHGCVVVIVVIVIVVIIVIVVTRDDF